MAGAKQDNRFINLDIHFTANLLPGGAMFAAKRVVIAERLIRRLACGLLQMFRQKDGVLLFQWRHGCIENAGLGRENF